MSNENDVPLGEGSRRYYEEKFGNRIRQVSKGGDAPRRSGSSSNSPGRVGCGAGIAIFIVFRIIVALINSSSHQTTYNAPPPRFNAVPFADNRDQDEDVQEHFRLFLKKNQPERAEPKPPFADADQKCLLTLEDIPFLEGLCYRIYHESLRPEETAGKHLLALMDEGFRPLIIKASRGEIFGRKESEQVLKGLNEVMRHDDFWNHECLARMRELQEKSRRHDNAQGLRIPSPGWLEERRLILQVCYSRQIVPLSVRIRLGEKARQAFREQAQEDLKKARRQFEGVKH